jgi:hypothetical protein
MISFFLMSISPFITTLTFSRQLSLLAVLGLGAVALASEAASGARSLQSVNLPPSPIPLGVPRSFQLSPGALVYYSFTVPTPFTGFHVSLTNSYGNSNLYVSLQPPSSTAWVTPNATYSDYFSSSMLSAEIVDIYPVDRLIRKSGCVRGYVGSTCTFVVGVSSSTNSLIWLTGYVDGACVARPLHGSTLLLRADPPPLAYTRNFI